MEEVSKKVDIRLSKSCIGEAEKISVMKVLENEYLGMGDEVNFFEKQLTKFFGRTAICVANGTAAIQLALQAAGISKGDEVLVQSLTYVASYQAISATGAIPVSCDVDPLTFCLDWRDAEKKLTSKTKAVMPVHYGGGVGALEEIYEFAKKNDIRVIEDAAHAFGSYHGSTKVGSFGDIACFSFDGIKNITSGEGGCVVTNDEYVLERLRDARLLGVEKDTEKRFSGERSWEFDVKSQGWRYHMSNIMAAIGIEQLNRFESLSSRRQEIAKAYDKELEDVLTINTLPNDYSKIVPHIFVVLLDKSINRSDLQDFLTKVGIQTGIHYYPNHKLSMYKNSNDKFQVIDDIYYRILTLPLHPDISMKDVKLVCNKLKSFVNHIEQDGYST